MMYLVSVKEMQDILRYMFNMNISTTQISMHWVGNDRRRTHTGEEVTERDIFSYGYGMINKGVAVQIIPTKVINSIEDYENIEGISASSELTPELKGLGNFIFLVVERRRNRAYEEKMKRAEEEIREEKKRQEKKSFIKKIISPIIKSLEKYCQTRI